MKEEKNLIQYNIELYNKFRKIRINTLYVAIALVLIILIGTLISFQYVYKKESKDSIERNSTDIKSFGFGEEEIEPPPDQRFNTVKGLCNEKIDLAYPLKNLGEEELRTYYDMICENGVETGLTSNYIVEVINPGGSYDLDNGIKIYSVEELNSQDNLLKLKNIIEPYIQLSDDELTEEKINEVISKIDEFKKTPGLNEDVIAYANIDLGQFYIKLGRLYSKDTSLKIIKAVPNGAESYIYFKIKLNEIKNSDVLQWSFDNEIWYKKNSDVLQWSFDNEIWYNLYEEFPEIIYNPNFYWHRQLLFDLRAAKGSIAVLDTKAHFIDRSSISKIGSAYQNAILFLTESVNSAVNLKYSQMFIDTNLILGLVYQEIGKFSESEAAYQKILNINNYISGSEPSQETKSKIYTSLSTLSTFAAKYDKNNPWLWKSFVYVDYAIKNDPNDKRSIELRKRLRESLFETVNKALYDKNIESYETVMSRIDPRKVLCAGISNYGLIDEAEKQNFDNDLVRQGIWKISVLNKNGIDINDYLNMNYNQRYETLNSVMGAGHYLSDDYVRRYLENLTADEFDNLMNILYKTEIKPTKISEVDPHRVRWYLAKKNSWVYVENLEYLEFSHKAIKKALCNPDIALMKSGGDIEKAKDDIDDICGYKIDITNRFKFEGTDYYKYKSVSDTWSDFFLTMVNPIDLSSMIAVPLATAAIATRTASAGVILSSQATKTSYSGIEILRRAGTSGIKFVSRGSYVVAKESLKSVIAEAFASAIFGPEVGTIFGAFNFGLPKLPSRISTPKLKYVFQLKQGKVLPGLGFVNDAEKQAFITALRETPEIKLNIKGEILEINGREYLPHIGDNIPESVSAVAFAKEVSEATIRHYGLKQGEIPALRTQLDDLTTIKTKLKENYRTFDPQDTVIQNQARTAIADIKAQEVLGDTTAIVSALKELDPVTGKITIKGSVSLAETPSSEKVWQYLRTLPENQGKTIYIREVTRFVGEGMMPGEIYALTYGAVDEFVKQVEADALKKGIPLENIVIYNTAITNFKHQRGHLAMYKETAHDITDQFKGNSNIAKNFRGEIKLDVNGNPITDEFGKVLTTSPEVIVYHTGDTGFSPDVASQLKDGKMYGLVTNPQLDGYPTDASLPAEFAVSVFDIKRYAEPNKPNSHGFLKERVKPR